jgi:hypothetical protein
MARRHFCELCDEENALPGFTPDTATCGHDEDHEVGFSAECHFIIAGSSGSVARNYIRAMRDRRRRQEDYRR